MDSSNDTKRKMKEIDTQEFHCILPRGEWCQ